MHSSTFATLVLTAGRKHNLLPGIRTYKPALVQILWPLRLPIGERDIVGEDDVGQDGLDLRTREEAAGAGRPAEAKGQALGSDGGELVPMGLGLGRGPLVEEARAVEGLGVVKDVRVAGDGHAGHGDVGPAGERGPVGEAKGFLETAIKGHYWDVRISRYLPLWYASEKIKVKVELT